MNLLKKAVEYEVFSAPGRCFITGQKSGCSIRAAGAGTGAFDLIKQKHNPPE